MDKQFSDYLARIRFLLIITGTGMAVMGACLGLVGNTEIFWWVNRNITAAPVFWLPARFFSFFGEWAFMLFAVLMAFRISYKTVIVGLFTWFTGACFSWLFKLWIFSGALRPYEALARSNPDMHVVDGVNLLRFNTFPSGHTLTAFYAIFFMAYIFQISRLGYAMLWMVAALCGISRIVLVQHWPEDVFAGSILGTSAALLAIQAGYYLPTTGWLNQKPKFL